MKIFLISWAILSQLSPLNSTTTPPISYSDPFWHTNYEQAMEVAQRLNRPVLIVFSGSDWCAACIRFKRDVLSKKDFTNFAHQNLVLLNLDFPRRKKNRLPEPIVQKNEGLAAQYNVEGLFPRAVLVDTGGKILVDFKEGFTMGPEQLVSYLKKHL